ncbi:hypothetical protein GCM10027570_23660 [Streptomonospora sediminis]
MTGTEPLTDDDPGRIGGYTLSGRLGQGGQGVVYLGRDDTDGAPVAVKTLHADGLDAAGLRRQLGEEIETARRVARFCTAQVLAADIDADPPYVVSEYIEGPTLQQVVRQSGPMRGAGLERLAVGTLTALAAIHQAGIVHRDFKPGNVLIGPDGPRVIDFGIARALEGTAILTSQIAGTPAYMAPEQIGGEALGPAVDLFSWGATMVFAANGWAPFGQDSLSQVLHNVCNEPADLGALDGRLREIAARCLAKNPADRPTAAETLMGVLGVAMAEPASAGAAEEPAAAPDGDSLPVHTLAAGAVAAAAPEARERTAEELRDSLPQGGGAIGDDGIFRSFPPGSGPAHAAGAGAPPAAPSGPQTPPPGPGGWSPPPGSPAPHSGPQTPYPAHGDPAAMPPTGGQVPYGPGSSAPPTGGQPPYAPGPARPPGAGPHSGPQQPYASSGAAHSPLPPSGPQQPPYGPGAPAAPTGGQPPYGPGSSAPPTGGQPPYAPGPARPPGAGPHSGPQPPHGSGPGGPGMPHSGPQPPYGQGQGQGASGPPQQPPAPYGPGGGGPPSGPQQQAPYGPQPGAPAKQSGGSGKGGAGGIIAGVVGASILVVIGVVAVIAVIVGG